MRLGNCPRSAPSRRGDGALGPPVEPTAARRRVDRIPLDRRPPSPLSQVPPGVQQHVREPTPHLSRRAKDTQVVAIREHTPGTPERSVHPARKAGGKRLHPAPERLAPVRFDDEVRMIALDRVVDDAKRASLATLRERTLDRSHRTLRPETGEILPDLQRHMAGESPRELLAREMSDRRIRTRLAPGAWTPPAPRAAVERKLGLRLPRMTHSCVVLRRRYSFVKGTD